jgi:hypothetical protein
MSHHVHRRERSDSRPVELLQNHVWFLREVAKQASKKQRLGQPLYEGHLQVFPTAIHEEEA